MIDRTGSPRTTSSRSPLVRALVSKRAMLVGIAGAALLVVQVAQAQAPNGNAITLARSPMIHVVQPGNAPPERSGVRSSLDEMAPEIGPPLAMSAGLHINATIDSSITGDPNDNNGAGAKLHSLLQSFLRHVPRRTEGGRQDER